MNEHDLNPTERFWEESHAFSILTRYLSFLANALVDEWTQIPSAAVQNLAEIHLKRTEAVTAAVVCPC